MKSKKLQLLLIGTLCLDIAMIHDLSRMPSSPMLTMMDVGQGDALLLTSSENHRILVDGGEGNSVLTELSEILPESFREIDLMIMTHPHRDHIEGLIPVLKRFQVNAVLMSAPHYDTEVYDAFMSAVSREETPVYFADDDMDFKVGDLELDVLYPFDPSTGDHMENINNASPVIKIGDWALLTGDAEHEVEVELLTAEVDVRARILKAGHHGSRTSTTDAFLEVVDPEIVLLSAGGGNKHGHPHKETLDKLQGYEVYRTDVDGRVSLGCVQSWLPRLSAYLQNVRILDQCS